MLLFQREFALGAPRRDIHRLVLSHGLRLAGIGVAIGLVMSLGLARVIRGLLVGVSPTDPPTFGAVAAILMAVAALACYLPARRATAVDPVGALRTGA